MSNKYVLYRRLSVEDKSRSQHGFASQMNDIENFLEKQDSPEVIGSFKEFISGASDHKAELEKALQLCKETGATLLIAKLDRLSRRVSQIANLMESNIELKVALMPNASTFELHIYSSLAQQEREMIRDRVTKGLAVVKRNTPEKLRKTKGTKWHESFKTNKALGLHRPSPTQYTINPNTQSTIDEIKKVVKLVNVSTFQELTDKLNRASIFTATGKEWTRQSLCKFCNRYEISLK